MEVVKTEIEVVKNCQNKFQRKKTWAKIHDAFSASPDLITASVLDDIHLVLFQGLEDESERCRELCSLTLLQFFPKIPQNRRYFHLFYPILSKKLEKSTSFEPSEEVRLIWHRLNLENVKQEGEVEILKPFVDDMAKILESGLEDDYPEIKLVTGDSIQYLYHNYPSVFPLFASSILKSVLKNFCHQQKKVRLSAVQSLEIILRNSDCQTFDSSVLHLMQKHFDLSPEVRVATSKLAGQLLLDWPYRREKLTHLIPLILTGLEDEIEENVKQVRQIWLKVGEKWLEEECKQNKQVKDLADFPTDAPSHYPQNVVRPSLGCRIMVSRIFFKLREALHRDLQDWQSETKIKTVLLLRELILHCEQDLVGHAEVLIDIFHSGIRDCDPDVTSKVTDCVFLFAHFVSPKTWTMLVLSRLNDSHSVFELRILSQLILGSSPDCTGSHIEDIAITLQSDDISQTINDFQLIEVLNCASALLRTYGTHCKEVERHLFKCILSIISLAQDEDLKNKAKDTMEDLRKTLGYEQSWEIYKHQMGVLLKELSLTCSDWQPSSYHAEIFAKLLTESGFAAGFYVDEIQGIMNTAINQQKNGSPEIQLKLFLALSKQLSEVQGTLNSQGNFDIYSHKLVKDLILPHLKWHSGRKFQAVRTAALISLWNLLHVKAISANSLNKLSTDLLPRLNALVEDDSPRIREFALKCFKEAAQILEKTWNADHLMKCYSIILKRMDDVSDDVRMFTLEALEVIPNCLEKETPEKEQFLENIFVTLILHMDDKMQPIRKHCADTLKKLSIMDPPLLEKVLASNSAKNKHLAEVNELADYLSSIRC